MSKVEHRNPDQVILNAYIDPDTNEAVLAVGVSEHGKRTAHRYQIVKSPVELTNIATNLLKVALERANMEVRDELA